MLKSLSFYTSSLLFTVIISFSTIPIFTRYLSPSEYGILAIYAMFGGIFVNVLSIGMSGATVLFYYKLNIKDFSSLNFTNLIFLIFMFIAGFFLLQYVDVFIVNNIFNNNISKDIIYFSYLYGCLFKLYSYFLIQFIHQKKAKEHFVYSIIFTSIFTILSLILLLIYMQGLYSRIYAGLIVLIILIPFIIYSHRQYLSLKFSASKLKKSIVYSYPYVPGSIVAAVNDSFDKTMLTNFKGSADVGLYQIAQTISSMNDQIFDIFKKIFSPYFLENAVNLNKENSTLIITNYYRLMGIFSIISFVVSLFSLELIQILTTEEYYFAAYLVPLFIATIFLNSLVNVVSKPQLMIAEKLIYDMFSSIAFVILNVLLNLYLIPLYGPFGALIALFFSTLVSNIMTLYFSQKFLYLPLSYLKIFIIYSMFILSLFPIYLLILSNYAIWQIIIIKLIFLLIYIFLIIKLSILDWEIIKKYANVFFMKTNFNIRL